MTKIITANGCPWCDKTKEYLTRKGILFTEQSVDNLSADEIKELVNVIGSEVGVPVICNEKTGKCTTGFDPTKIDDIIKEQ